MPTVGDHIKIVSVVKVRQAESRERNASPGTQRSGVEVELVFGLRLAPGLWLVVEQPDPAVADLKYINVTSQHTRELKVRRLLGKEVDWHLNSDGRGVVRQHETLNRFVAITSPLGQDKTKLRQRDCVRILANKPESQLRNIPIRATGAAGLKQLIWAVVHDVPDVSPDLRELTLAQDVRLESVKLKPVLLLMRERAGLNHFLFREAFTGPHAHGRPAAGQGDPT